MSTTDKIIERLCSYLDDTTASMIGFVMKEQYEEASICRDHIDSKLKEVYALLLKQKDLIDYSKKEIWQLLQSIKEKYHEEYMNLFHYIKERSH